MDSKTACLSFLKANNEAEAILAMEAIPEMADPANWRPLGGTESNFNVVGNQQSDGAKALTELVTNMGDAILLKACRQAGIVDPRKDPRAPANMYEAVQEYFPRIKGGRLANVDDEAFLRDLSRKNMVIGVSGYTRASEGHPSFMFMDNGEGQHPDDFERTFLSTSERNKTGIPFVQGRFNMGSSGALSYSGTRSFKFIASRRFDRKGEWGWTLVRVRPTDDHSQNPVYEYFAPGGRIARFESDRLEPLYDRFGEPYGAVGIETGSVVKVYDYKVENRFSSHQLIRNLFNENLIDALLPARIYDARQKPNESQTKARTKGIDERSVNGLEYTFLRGSKKTKAGREEEEDDGKGVALPVQVVGSELGEIRTTAYFFEKGVPSSFRKDALFRVLHHVNGQVHLKERRGLLTSLGYSALKDKVIVLVDASGLTNAARNAIWKGDRESLKRTIQGDRYLQQVHEAIKNDGELRALNERIAQEERARASNVDTDAMFASLAKADRKFLDMLNAKTPGIELPRQVAALRVAQDESTLNGEVVDPPVAGTETDDFEGRREPTFLRLRDFPFDGALEVPANRSLRVVGETDAADDFHTRTANTGVISARGVGKDRFSTVVSLRRGVMRMTFTPAEAEVGSVHTVSIRMFCITMDEPVFSEEFQIKVVEAVPDKKPKEKAPSPEQEEADQMQGLPRVVIVTEDGRDVSFGGEAEKTFTWEEYDMVADDGGYVRLVGEEPIHVVNYDNSWHRSYRTTERAEARDLLSMKYLMGMRITLLTLYKASIGLKVPTVHGRMPRPDN